MEPLELHATLGLAPRPESAARARRFIDEFCTAAGLRSDICQTAALLTSELVTNAVLHGRSRVRLHAHLPPGLLRVEVEDTNPQLPPDANDPSADSEGGRGLKIVSALAVRWGAETSGSGKFVWFEIALPDQ